MPKHSHLSLKSPKRNGRRDRGTLTEQLALREVFHRAWGPYLHIGVFRHPEESVAVASARAARLAADRVAPKSGDRVLEVGCGYGHTAQMLARRFGCRVTAVDIEEWRVQEARRRAKHVEGLVFERADHGDLPYANETFDLVWATLTLSYARDLCESISEASRVLKTGGKIALRDFCTSPRASDPETLAQLTHTPRLWPISRWKAALVAAKMQPVDVDDETDDSRETYRRLREVFQGMVDEFGPAAIRAVQIMDQRLELIDRQLFGCFFLVAVKEE